MINTQILSFQRRHACQDSKNYTHVIPDRRLKYMGKFKIQDETSDAALREAYAKDISKSMAPSIYERLTPSFRLFIEFNHVADSEKILELCRELFRIAGICLHTPGRGDNVFFAQMNLAKLRATAMYNGRTIRLVFEDVFVNLDRVVKIHRYFLDCMDQHMNIKFKREVLPGAEKSFRIPNASRWKSVCPVDAYFNEMGVLMHGGRAVLKCDSTASKSHGGCESCNGMGYVHIEKELVVVALLSNIAKDPAVSTSDAIDVVVDTDSARELTEMECLEMTSVRTSQSMTERYMEPLYIPSIPPSTKGLIDFSQGFECERRRGKSKEISVFSNDFHEISVVLGIMRNCRRLHPMYANIGVHKVYKTPGANSVYRAFADGQNSNFCMRQKRHRECRASFVIEQVDGKGKIYMECLSEECMDRHTKRRYTSQALNLTDELNDVLGFRRKGEDESWLESYGQMALDRMRGNPRKNAIVQNRRHYKQK